jgi:predicted ribonuclease YlaK
MDKLYLIDTNVLLESPEVIEQYNVVILSHVIRELEKHKLSFNKDLAFKSRRATRYLEKHRSELKFDTSDYQVSFDEKYDKDYTDNKIIQCCLDNDYGIISNDFLLKIKAEGLGIEILDVTVDNNDEYSGIHELFLTKSKEDQQILASIYENQYRNTYKLFQNQYLYIWNKDKPTYDEDGVQTGYEFIDNFRFDGEKLIKLRFKPIFSKFTGDKIRPINKKQEMLFDLLQNKEQTIKTCFGKYGVGKDFVMINHALDLVEQQKVDKLIWARNNVELEDVPTLGILPGDKIEKLLEFAMPLADHVGGVEGLRMLILSGKIEIQHLGSLRGRDIKRSIIYVTECQNNTNKHIKLLIGRVGKDSQLWLNGDLKQTDKEIYKQNSGIRALSVLKGNRLFGQVTLDKTERSDTAQLAELIED